MDAVCCRVIALAYKVLDKTLSPMEISSLTREEVESDLDFGGFAIFQCPLKEESEPALRMLKVLRTESPCTIMETFGCPHKSPRIPSHHLLPMLFEKLAFHLTKH